MIATQTAFEPIRALLLEYYAVRYPAVLEAAENAMEAAERKGLGGIVAKAAAIAKLSATLAALDTVYDQIIKVRDLVSPSDLELSPEEREEIIHEIAEATGVSPEDVELFDYAKMLEDIDEVHAKLHAVLDV